MLATRVRQQEEEVAGTAPTVRWGNRRGHRVKLGDPVVFGVEVGMLPKKGDRVRVVEVLERTPLCLNVGDEAVLSSDALEVPQPSGAIAFYFWGNGRDGGGQWHSGYVRVKIVEHASALPRLERLRQRALAQGILNVDEGPVDEELVRMEGDRVGVPYEALCDTIEALLDADEP